MINLLSHLSSVAVATPELIDRCRRRPAGVERSELYGGIAQKMAQPA